MTLISPFRILSKDTRSKARTGVLYTKHGAVHTPVFMPVATQACVKALTADDIRDVGAECILSNTYHYTCARAQIRLKKWAACINL